MIDAAREDAQWWREKYSEPDKRGKKLFDVVKVLWEQANPWRQQAKLNAGFYGEKIDHAISPRSYRGRHSAGQKAQRLTLNALRNAADTYVAILTQDIPKITCMTTGAAWDEREKAELTEEFLDGCFAETNFDMIALLVARFSVLFEPGWAFFYIDDSDPDRIRPAVEAVLPTEVLFSDEDALYGNPRSYYRMKWCDRNAVIAEYAADDKELEARLRSYVVSGMVDDGASSVGIQAGVDMIPLVAAWHLPRVKPKKAIEEEPKAEDSEEEPAGEEEKPKPQHDGRYVLCAGSVVIADEEYTKLRPPLEPLFTQRPLTGLRACSMVENMTPIQRDRNIVSQRLQKSIHMVGQPHIMVEKGSVNTNKLDNANASIVEYQAGRKPPETYTPNVASPQMFEREQTLGAEIYSCTGVSPQIAQGVKPAGLNSGEAQKVHADLASARFKPQYRELQDFYLRSGQQFLSLADDIAEIDPEFWTQPSMGDAVRWAEARFDGVDDLLRLAPTNALADSPEGREDLIQDLINGGTIPQQDGMRLIAQGRDDLLGYLKEQPWFASYQYTQRSITAILRGKKPLPVTGYMDLAAAFQAAKTAWLDASVGGCPQDRLGALDVWITQIQNKMDANKPPPPPPPGAPSPPGAPGAPKPGGPMSVAAHLAPPLAAPPGAG